MLMIHDISKELFSAEVYPGDFVPVHERLASIDDGSLYNLSHIELGSHSGTHIDAPLHFVAGGTDISGIDLAKCYGECLVVTIPGCVRVADAGQLISANPGLKRVIFRGGPDLEPSACRFMIDSGIVLVGTDAMSVEYEGAPKPVHDILLGGGAVILENVVLDGVDDGKYILSCLPVKMEGLDGSPVRAVLIDI